MNIKAIHFITETISHNFKPDEEKITRQEEVTILQFAVFRDMSNELRAIYVNNKGEIHWDAFYHFKVKSLEEK